MGKIYKQGRSVFYAGFMAGSIGAVSVAVWFSIIDLIEGRPFFTPAALGSKIFFNIGDPAKITVGVLPVLSYTGLHFLAFFIVATTAALIFKETRKNQNVLWYALEFFIVLEVGFYSLVGMLFTPLLAELAWINLAIGNLISSIAMGWYFYKTEPALKIGLFD